MKNKRFLVLTFALGAAGLLTAGAVFAHGSLGSKAGTAGLGFARPGHEAMFENKADILGLNTDELQSKLESGKTFMDIAEEQGIDPDDIHESMKERMSEFLDEKVQNGYLTQEEADARLEWMDEMHEQRSEEGCGMGAGRSFRMNHIGMHGGMMGR